MKQEWLQIRIGKHLKRKLDKESARQDLSRSEAVRLAIREWLKQN